MGQRNKPLSGLCESANVARAALKDRFPGYTLRRFRSSRRDDCGLTLEGFDILHRRRLVGAFLLNVQGKPFIGVIEKHEQAANAIAVALRETLRLPALKVSVLKFFQNKNKRGK